MRKEVSVHARIVNVERYAAMADNLATGVNIVDHVGLASMSNPSDVPYFQNSKYFPHIKLMRL
jgi:hypothetical protein